MKTTFTQLTVLVAFCFLVSLAGCCDCGMSTNASAKGSKKAMTDAANQLVAAIKEMKTITEKYPNSNDVPIEEFRESLTTFKTKTKAISLDDCADEFKDAFAMWEQTLIADWEFAFETVNTVRRIGDRRFLSPAVVTETQRLSQQCRDTETRFKAVCRKLELNVSFDGDAVLEKVSDQGQSGGIIPKKSDDFDFDYGFFFPGTTGGEFEFEAFPGVTAW